MKEQLLAPVLEDGTEDLVEVSLRPPSLGEFVGQPRIKEQLAIALQATRARGEALVELGFSAAEAEQALASTDPDAPTEERVRQALRQAA